MNEAKSPFFHVPRPKPHAITYNTDYPAESRIGKFAAVDIIRKFSRLVTPR